MYKAKALVRCIDVSNPPKSIEEVLEALSRDGIEWVDLQVTDLSGKLHHVTIHRSMVDEDSLKEGFGKLDGSSVAGFSTIDDSDLVLKPVIESYAVLPWYEATARFLTQVYWNLGRGRFERDPRWVSERTEELLAGEGLTAYTSVEPEFFIFDGMEFNVSMGEAYYRLYSSEATWSSDDYKGIRTRPKKGYYPAPPQDQLMDIRMEIVNTLRRNFNVPAEVHHHEVATGGQAEVNFRFATPTVTGDRLQTLKYVAKMVAYKHGKVATFMPKPVLNDNGSGMHTHVSIWRGDTNLFYDESDEYAELSQYARYFIGGLLEHGRALSAILSPTVNSYRRLVPGFEAPVYLAWSRANRSATVRVPVYYKGDSRSKRIEYRPPDPAANPYLALPAIIMAGLDGVRKKIEPGDPVDENIYHMSAEKRRQLGIKSLPGSLEEALQELESDNEFLKPAFSESVISAYLDLKWGEVKEARLHPSPIEFLMYHDV